MSSRTTADRAVKQASHLTDIDEARRVIQAEARALDLLADSLGQEFLRAVEAVLSARGRVIVSGMGKSGHVARKIAATLASTGTPAQFVHPAEASHGDLGMLTSEDVALVLSNSGETPELADLVSYTRRQSIPLIGVAAASDSALLKMADIALLLPAAEEACPLGLAPTTSTTATMALGDALAVAVMQRRDFTPAHFRMLHPGGQLGSKLLQVRDLMHDSASLPLVSPDTPMADALLEMSAKGFGVVGVVDGSGRLTGVISDGDLRRGMDGLLERTAKDIATNEPKVTRPEALVEEAVKYMNDSMVLVLFVAERPEDGPSKPVGLLHIHDCLRAGIG